jgi:hypothetical protein
MCKGSGHCGWGEELEPYWHAVLCRLTDLSRDGLWVNHYTWTNTGPTTAQCVGTWGKLDDRTWVIDVHLNCVNDRGLVCTIEVRLVGVDGPIIVYELDDHLRNHTAIDRRLDVILKEVTCP